MVKIEISKRTYIERYIYALYILVIIFFIKKIYDSGGMDGYLILIILAILASLRLIPVLPLKRHTKYGQLIADNDHFEIERYGRKVTYEISQVNKLKIKLMGFDGQPFYKHMDHLRPREMAMKKLVNGLENYVWFNYRMSNHKYELYFGEQDDYEKFKELAGIWHKKHPDIGLDLER